MYIERLFAPHWGWIGALFYAQTHGQIQEIEVFYLSKPVYTADKPSDCHYCYFWTNGRKGCRLGRNNCYYLISLPPKPKSECDGCPYGRDHPCIGWCTKKVMREVGLRWYGCVWTGIPLLLFCPMSLRKTDTTFRSIPLTTESFPQKEGGEAVWVLIIFTVSNPIYSHSIEFRRCCSRTRGSGIFLPMPRCCMAFCLTAWACLPRMVG